MLPSFCDRVWWIPTLVLLPSWGCLQALARREPQGRGGAGLLIDFFAAVGVTTLVSRLRLDLLPFVRRNFLRRPLAVTDLYSRYGAGGEHGGRSYACVTGATSGIGLEFARQLALAGFNLVLMGRTDEKLRSARSELLRALPDGAPPEIRLVAHGDLFDVVRCSPAGGGAAAGAGARDASDFFARVVADGKLDQLDVAIFVNNAGTLGLGKLADQSMDSAREVFEVSCLPVLYFTKLMCEQMRRRTPRSGPGSEQRSAIINVSSRAAFVASPGAAVYASSKGFVDQFTQNVSYEMRPEGIDILSLRPGLVSTRMTQNLACTGRRLVNGCVSAEATVKAALLQTMAGESVVSGPWQHEADMMYWHYLQSWFPETVKQRRYQHYCAPGSLFAPPPAGEATASSD